MGLALNIIFLTVRNLLKNHILYAINSTRAPTTVVCLVPQKLLTYLHMLALNSVAAIVSRTRKQLRKKRSNKFRRRLSQLNDPRYTREIKSKTNTSIRVIGLKLVDESLY